MQRILRVIFLVRAIKNQSEQQCHCPKVTEQKSLNVNVIHG